jgi:thiol-disulfide isomerase/thioredoxin
MLKRNCYKAIKIFTFFLVCLCTNLQAQVQIKGKLLNFNNRTTLFDFSEVGELRLPNNEREIIPDKNGNFTLTFSLVSSNYFRLGRNVMYLSPNDKLNVKIDYNAPEKSEFSGTSAEENNYLKNTPSPKSGSYLSGSLNIDRDIDKTIANILQLAGQRKVRLDRLNTVSKEFISLEKARIDIDVLNSCKFLTGYYKMKFRVKEEDMGKINAKRDSLRSVYFTKCLPYADNALMLKLETFRKNSYGLVEDYNQTNQEIEIIKDWQYAYGLFYKINSTIDKTALYNIRPEIEKIKNIYYKKAISETLALKSKYWDGDTAIDFAADDSNGKKVKLSSFKGKIIFIDLWATWCGPCLEEMPYFDRLRNKYEANSDIVFISLCVNDNIGGWKKNLKSRKAEGIQLFASQPEMVDYKILSLPRSIIIDKDFKIVKLYGPDPSNPGIPDFLEELLKDKLFSVR